MGVTKPTSVSKAVSVRLPPRVVAEIDARASKEALADMAKLTYDRAEQAGLSSSRIASAAWSRGPLLT